jgi:Holliday junction resolvase-like predicted endonuclease
LVRFILNGEYFELSADDVRNQLRDAEPEPVQQLGVRVNGRLYPVKQAFELATQVQRSSFTSRIAQRHLAALGFELIGQRDSVGVTRQRDLRADRGGPASSQVVRSGMPRRVNPGEWHTESRVQSAVISFLVRNGWQIISAADTARREHGIDIVAVRQGYTVAIEVKGFPSRHYADPSRAGEEKRTQPSTQAKHWYAQAVLAAMLTRSRRRQDQAVIALPDFPDTESFTQSRLTRCRSAPSSCGGLAKTAQFGKRKCRRHREPSSHLAMDAAVRPAAQAVDLAQGICRDRNAVPNRRHPAIGERAE